MIQYEELSNLLIDLEQLKNSNSNQHSNHQPLLTIWERLCKTIVESPKCYQITDKIIKILASKFENSLFIKTNNKDNPLHLAIVQKNFVVIELILKNYKDQDVISALNQFNQNGYCPILIACAMLRIDFDDPDRDGKVSVLEKILDAPVEKEGSSRIAAEEDDSVETKRSSRSSSRSGSQSRSKNSKKSTAKILSFSRNNGRSLDNLWNKNTTNSLSFIRKNPMILACSYGNYYALDYLLSKGLDTEIRDSLENTPLILAAEKRVL